MIFIIFMHHVWRMNQIKTDEVALLYGFCVENVMQRLINIKGGIM